MNLLALLPLTLALAGNPDQIVSFGKGVDVPAGRKVEQVVAIGGPVTVDGEVEEGVVAIGGPATLNGKVGDDLVVIGSAKVGPKAEVEGDLVVIGGQADIDPAAQIGGQKTVIGVGEAGKVLSGPLGAVGLWLHEGLAKLRVIPHSRPAAWGVALILLLGYVLVALAAPGPVETCAAVLTRQPAQAFLAGLLVVSCAAPIALVFLVSVAGIALLPALAGLLLIGAIVGRAAVMRVLGGRLAPRLPTAGAVALGGVLLMLLFAAPILGLPLWGLVLMWGLGAASLAGFDAARPMVSSETSTPKPAAPSAVAAEIVPSADETLPRASFGLRLAATAIDVVAVAVIAGLTPVLTFGIGAWALYQIGLWTWKGTTLGGIVVGVRGVRLDGRPMDVTVAAVRHLASYFSAFACFLGFFWAAWDPQRQTWHDKIAGTVVVRVPRVEPLI